MVTLQEVKQYLRIDFEDDDTLKYMRNIIDEDTKNKIKSAY